MTFPYRTVLMCITLLLGACASRDEPVPVHVRCENAVSQAENRFKSENDGLTSENQKRIVENLITAARIEQQQARFISCLERAQRALQLMDEANTSE